LYGYVVVLGVLILAGWVVSYYFYGVYRGRLSRKVGWLPAFVQMGDCRGETIVNTPYGRTLGQPNAFWGLWYYAGLLVLLGLTASQVGVYSFILVDVAFVTFLFSLYLMWGLYRLQVTCRPCLTVHLINLLIFLFALRLIWI